jgi:hypothetical protein
MAFTPAQLLEIGMGERKNYIVLSSYRYDFGNISVEYLGMAGFIFKIKSKVLEEQENIKKKSDQIMAQLNFSMSLSC